MIHDLTKTTKALLGVKSPAGQKALEVLYGHLNTFRGKIGKDLNDAEFRYVMQTLFNEQVVTIPAEESKRLPSPALLAHGFTIRAVR